MTEDEAGILRQLRDDPDAVAAALKRDRENPRAWHAPDEAIESIELLAQQARRKAKKILRPPANAAERKRLAGDFRGATRGQRRWGNK